jgi:hypothetical protein
MVRARERGFLSRVRVAQAERKSGCVGDGEEAPKEGPRGPGEEGGAQKV